MISMPQTPFPAAALAAAPDFAAARQNMIDSQLRPNGVKDDGLLEVMGDLPRELFVPSTLVGIAYLDESIPLVAGRSLMPPMLLAKLIQAAEIGPKDRILDLAPATGYSTLVLAALGGVVIGVEPEAVLHKEAETNIATCAPGRAVVLAGAPVEGCKAQAPFDVIFVNGSVEFLPEILFDQLAEDGRLVAVIRRYGQAHVTHTGQARLYRKKGGAVSWAPLFDANVPPAPGFNMPRGFSF